MNRFANAALATALLMVAASTSSYVPLASAQSGPSRLINQATNQCVGLNISVQPTLMACNGAASQNWYRDTTIYGVRLRNAYTGRCISVNSSYRTITTTCDSTATIQSWRRVPYNVNSNFYQNRYNALCLDGSTANVYVRSCNSSAFQAWR